MPHDLLIRNATLVHASGARPADIAITAGKIAAVADRITEPATQLIDAAGLHIFPGLIDVHVHFNDPGRADWEGAATGSAALAAGGGTCFFDMPLNSSPPVLDGESFDAKVAALSGNSYADFALWGGLTPINLDKLEELAERGVVGFKAFMSDSGMDDFPRADDWTLQRGMEIAGELGLPVAVHAESQELTAGKTAWLKRELGTLGPAQWPLAREPLAEAEAIQRAILIAQNTRCKLHIVHISNRFAVGVADWARQSERSLPSPSPGTRATHSAKPPGAVSLETCPHYFTLSAEEVSVIGAAAKCAPPIRSAADTDQLWDSVRSGTIDIIGSDHSPAPPSMKTGNFWSAWGGIAGVQSTLAALLTRRPHLPVERIAQLIAATPASRFNIAGKGQLAVGYDADLSLVDLNAIFELQRDQLLDRHKLSPYVGRTFRGVVQRTILRGQSIFQDGKIVGQPTGQLLKPTR